MDYVLAKTATEAWDSWYDALRMQARLGFKADSRDGEVVGEMLNAVTVITDPRSGFCSSERRSLSIKYGIGELLWYLSGSNSLDDIKQYSSAWNNLSDDGKTVNSAYGHRIQRRYGFDQWAYIRALLERDPNTRQAVIHIKDADPTPTKDMPCTVCLQFFIRDKALHMTVYMRSNDIWMGFPYDVFCFTSFQCLMAMQLGVDVGEYTHIAGSLHLYERNLLQEEVENEG